MKEGPAVTAGGWGLDLQYGQMMDYCDHKDTGRPALIGLIK